MGISVAIAAGQEPVDLARVKAHLRLLHNYEDDLLTSYLVAAREFCEGETRRVFVSQTIDYTIDFEWPWRREHHYILQRIDLPFAPVTVVNSISYIDLSGASKTLDPSAYVTKLDSDSPYIVPTYNTVWQTVRYQPHAITVRYVAGWNANEVPESLKTAICTHVEILLDRDPAQAELLERVRDNLLDPYRIKRIF